MQNNQLYTTSLELDKLLRTNTDKYAGLFLYDQLKNLNINVMKDAFIVINYITTEEAKKNIIGHFVVLDNRNRQKGISHNNRQLFFFDSYGFQPDIPRDIMHLPNTHEITKFIDRLRNPAKFSHYNTSVSMLAMPVNFGHNTFDFQYLAPWDDTCGVYSFIYSENPSFYTNKFLNPTQTDRKLIDEKITYVAVELGIIQ